MKTQFYALIFLISASLSAQPEIGPNTIVSIGEADPTTFLTFGEANWNSGSSGIDVFWDYSTLSMGEVCDYQAMDPVDSPYYDSFPNSDIYFICTFSNSSGFETEQHTFYQVEGDVLRLSGNVSISISNPSFDSIFTVFTNVLDWATFPYMYEDSSEDTFEARVTSYISGQAFAAIQTGTSTHEVDSYGTLTTPAGTFENTLRVKRVELTENSIPGVQFTTEQETYRYTWYAENENGVILNLDSIVILDFTGSVQNINLAGSYRTNGPTSTNTEEIIQGAVKIFPNPFAQEITIELADTNDYNVYIYTVNGIALPYSILDYSDHAMKIRLDQTIENPGIYYVSMIHKYNGKNISKPIVIQP